MKFKILLLLLIVTSGIYAQNDSIVKERYEVINALYKNGKPTLDKHFLQYLGIGKLISNPEMIDNLLGHCIDMEKRETYSFSEIVSSKEISKMRDQISWFQYYRNIDSTMVSDNINITEDLENTIPAITLPLIYNDKAVVYVTNKKNEETLFVLVKKDNEWVVRCTKNVYLRFDD
ncbi:hypothetical protein [Mesonia sp.]|uniref:hypothetical protein n=1 Tax=Mesonia sp. TaxID=1960830 RepID=UPI003F99FDB2